MMANDNLEQLTSANQGDQTSLWAALNYSMRQQQLNIDGMLPAKVISFDRKANTATVQPMIHFVGMDNESKPRSKLAKIPVLSIGGGGFHISFPIKAGDLCWIFASDRDINNFLKELKEDKPPHGRIKTFSSGLVIPDVFRQYVINGEDSDAMVIQSTDGSTRISIRGDNIKITAPTKVLIDTPLTEFTKDVKIDGKLDVTEKTTVNGGFEATGSDAVTLPQQTTINNIVVVDHGHEQNGDSGRTSGGMEP